MFIEKRNDDYKMYSQAKQTADVESILHTFLAPTSIYTVCGQLTLREREKIRAPQVRYTLFSKLKRTSNTHKCMSHSIAFPPFQFCSDYTRTRC